MGKFKPQTVTMSRMAYQFGQGMAMAMDANGFEHFKRWLQTKGIPSTEAWRQLPPDRKEKLKDEYEEYERTHR